MTHPSNSESIGLILDGLVTQGGDVSCPFAGRIIQLEEQGADNPRATLNI